MEDNEERANGEQRTADGAYFQLALPERKREDLDTSIVKDPAWTKIYIAWRARYQQCRRMCEQTMKQLQALSVLHPLLFDPNTEDGWERRNNVIEMANNGDYESLKAFISHWKPILEKIERERILANKQNPNRKGQAEPHSL